MAYNNNNNNKALSNVKESKAYDSCKFGKSENEILDKFILERRLKWIPYNQFKNVEYLDKGGFGTIYKAIWLQSSEDSEDDEERKVALKCLNNLNENNLNENLDKFLNEWDCHEKCLSSTNIIYLHGFTKNPDTLDYMGSQACYTSRLLDFTSIKVNEILESKCLDHTVDNKSNEKLDEIAESECLEYIVDNIKSLDIKTEKN
ncbi:kinase-like domain-containing protein [Rhizophagus clarus]|uniref:Kinase-like domain-containing protein n=1 Tax=Rhizophagus clarus TaxID=94130 RepID=A0A8H3M248_9GLOM|nr:kinase-like domain-containing protein [Rhizophagus clarus]